MNKLILYMILCVMLFSGCDNSTEPKVEPLSLSIEVVNVSSQGGTNGSIDLTVEGGKRPYTFEWSNGSTNEDVANLSEGTYTVTVTDSESQVETISVEIYSHGQTGTVTDIDGNVYKTIVIGKQVWMAENLRVTHNPNGDAITSYIYNNVQSHVDIYGRHYTWNSVMNGATSEKAQGIAPDGWHIPSDTEWQELFDFLGGISVAGGKMKSTGTDYWDAPNSNATNSSGFSSLPAGGGYPLNFEGMGMGTHYWSSTSHGSTAMAPTVHSGKDVLVPKVPKTMSLSVRCIKD